MTDRCGFKACRPQRIVSNLLTVNTESVDCVRGLNSPIFKYSLRNSRSDFITCYALDFIFLVETWPDVDISLHAACSQGYIVLNRLRLSGRMEDSQSFVVLNDCRFNHLVD